MLQLVQNILNEIHFGDEEKNSDDVPGGTNLLVYCEINVRKLLPYIPYWVCLLSVQKAIEKKNFTLYQTAFIECFSFKFWR